MKRRLFAVLIATMLFPAVLPAQAWADAETEALRAQIRLLEARLEALEKREQERNRQAAVLAAPAPAKLEERIAAVEHKQEAMAAAAPALKEESAPKVDVALGKGLTVSSPDKQYSLNLRGFVQADTRAFLNNSNTSNVDTFLIRTARPILDAKLTDWFAGRLMYDVSSNTLPDAYLDARLDPMFNLRVGKFKLPLGIERWQSEQNLVSVERGVTTSLVADRDIGVMAFGKLIPDLLEYHVAATNGAPDLNNNTSDADDQKDITARLFATPFAKRPDSWLAGLGFGLAGSYGHHDGTATSPNLTEGFRTPGQARFFTYRGGGLVQAEGAKWRLNPQLAYYNGPFSLFGEYLHNVQKLQRAGIEDTLSHRAWFAASTYVLTGEKAAFEGVTPKRNFNPRKGEWGAFELMARYGQLDVDNDAFPFYADPNAAASRADEAVIGLNWYFNPAVKLQMNLAWTRFDGGAAGGRDREDEKLFSTRTQFKF